MQDNQITELMENAIERIKALMDTGTVVGVPFETKEGTLIIPLTKVSVGFVAGGGEYGENKKSDRTPMAGGTGGGVCVAPIGFLSIKNDNIKLIRIDEKSKYDKLLEMIPSVISNAGDLFNKGDKNAKKK